ncbi:MAG: hypothetical protein ACXVW7_18900 [Trebonia sp.]
MLLGDLSAHLARELPWTGLRCLGEGHDPVGVAQVVRHLGLPEQQVALHRGVARFLCPGPSSHDAIRGEGTFDTALATTAELTKRGFDTRIICTVKPALEIQRQARGMTKEDEKTMMETGAGSKT